MSLPFFRLPKRPRLKALSRLRLDSDGIATVEYALLLGLVVLTMLGALSSFASQVVATWTDVANQASNATSRSTAN